MYFPNPFKPQRCCQFLVLLSSVEIPGKWSHLFKCFFMFGEIGSQKANMLFLQHKLTKPHGILQGLRYVGGAFWSSWLLDMFLFFPWYSKHRWAFRFEPNKHQSENAQVLHQMGNQQGVPYLSHTESMYGIDLPYIWLIFAGKDIPYMDGPWVCSIPPVISSGWGGFPEGDFVKTPIFVFCGVKGDLFSP